ncbi:MAG: Non-canonical purine NTP pyrophosphatase [Methanosaeta sp. PtaU1.Bin112]|nr:MAG: Non-canonical purine NTP pyrophosphatase [Methanosaeta sp. PtaU1.Bin112]
MVKINREGQGKKGGMINFVTSNKGKYAEAQAILGDLVQMDIGYTEIQADTLEEVAIYGMKEVALRLKGAVMLEDAGLFVQALRGFPGVYSAYVQKTIGNAGILRLMEGEKNRSAYFKSVVAYAEPGMQTMIFSGEVYGQIGFEARGSQGFGYDPIFYVDGMSLAEIDLEKKNQISHRAKSMRALDDWLHKC